MIMASGGTAARTAAPGSSSGSRRTLDVDQHDIRAHALHLFEKAARIHRLLLLHHHPDGQRCRQACTSSHNSLVPMTSAMVNGYTESLLSCASLPALPVAADGWRGWTALRLRLRLRGGRRQRHELDGRLPGAACACAGFWLHQLLDRHGFLRRLHRHRPGHLDPGMARRVAGVPSRNGLGSFSAGSGCPAGNGPHQLRRHQHQQFRIVRSSPALWNSLPNSGMSPKPGTLLNGLGGSVVQQTRDHEALPALQFDFGLHAPRCQRRNVEALEHQAVGEIERADLRGDLQPDGAARRHSREES